MADDRTTSGGRTIGAVGVPQQPMFLYGGQQRRRLEDYRLWKDMDPIFDDQPTGSIGDIAVAPSNPNVIYVGSGEGYSAPIFRWAMVFINPSMQEKHEEYGPERGPANWWAGY